MQFVYTYVKVVQSLVFSYPQTMSMYNGIVDFTVECIITLYLAAAKPGLILVRRDPSPPVRRVRLSRDPDGFESEALPAEQFEASIGM